jgi:PAS domain S-box-containing protein
MLRILLLEDNPMDRDMICAALKKKDGWQIVAAPTCQQATELLRQSPPDFIISDIGLPDGNGLEWVRKIRQEGYSKPIFVLTGLENTTENVIAAIQAGADNFFVKDPETYQRITETIEKTLSESRRSKAWQIPLSVLYVIANPLEAEKARQTLQANAPHLQLQFAQTLPALKRYLAARQYDALVLDGNLPEESLPGLLRHLPMDVLAKTPFLVIDPNPTPEMARLFLTNGAAGYIPRSPSLYATLPLLLNNAVLQRNWQQEQKQRILSEARYSRLVENLPDVVYRFEFQPAPHLAYISPAIQTLTGYSVEQFFQDAEFLYRVIYPEDHAKLQNAFAQQTPALTLRWITKNGDVIWTEQRNTYFYDDDGTLLAAEGVARDITQQQRAVQAIEEHLEEVRLLADVGRIALESRDVDALCQDMATLIAERLYPEHFSILLLNPDQKTFRPHAAGNSLPPEILERDYPIDQGVIGRCLRTRKTIFVPDTSADPDYFPASPGMRSELVVPISAGETLFGALNVEKSVVNGFTPEDIHILEIIAQHMAMALERFHLLETEKKQRQEAEALRIAISKLAESQLNLDAFLNVVLEGLQTVIPFTSASVALIENNQAHFVAAKNIPAHFIGFRIRLTDDMLLSRMKREKEPILLADVSQHPEFEQFEHQIPTIRSWLGIPLVLNDEVIGGIFCDHSEAGVFNEEHIRLGMPFAQQVALVLEKVRLYEQERRHAMQLQTLHRISQDILQLNLQEDALSLYRSIHQAAGQLMPVDAFAIALHEGKTLHAVYLAEGDHLDPPRHLPKGSGLASWVIEHRESLLVDDLEEHEVGRKAQHFGNQRRTRAAIAVPLRLGDEVLGAMSAQSYEKGIYTEKDLQMLEMMATYVAITLKNQRLLQEIQRKLQTAESIQHIHKILLQHQDPITLREKVLAKLVEEIPAAEKGSILLLNADGSLRVDVVVGYSDAVTNTIFPPGKGYAHQAISHRQGLVVNRCKKNPNFYIRDDFAAEISSIRSAITVPLFHQGRPIGAISLDNTSDDDAFTQADLQLLETIAPSIALSIQNAQLFSSLQQSLEEIALRNRLLTALQKAHKVAETWQIFYDTVKPYLRLQAGLILQRQGKTWHLQKKFDRAADITPTTHLPQNVSEWAEEASQTRTTLQKQAAEDIHAALMPFRALPEWCLVLARETPFSEAEIQQLHALGELTENALQRILLAEQQQQQVALLSSLRDINTTLLSSLDFKVVFDLILSNLDTHLQPDRAEIWKANESLQELSLEAWRGGIRPTQTTVRYDQGFAGRVALKRDIVQENLERLPDKSIEYAGNIGIPLIAKRRLKGVLVLYYRSPRSFSFTEENFLRTLAGQAALAIDNTEVWRESQRKNMELFQAYESMLKAWGALLEMRNLETPGHTERVLDMGLKLARKVGLKGEDLLYFKWGVWLHDIGKLTIPEGLLKKEGPLTAEERSLLQRHPLYALEILEQIPFARKALKIPAAHHEHWDGSGYPRGLRGELIPLEARIFAIVDVWDTLQQKRPYSAPWPREKAIAHLREQSGKQFDPQLTELFLEMVEKGEI